MICGGHCIIANPPPALSMYAAQPWLPASVNVLALSCGAVAEAGHIGAASGGGASDSDASIRPVDRTPNT